MSDVEDSPLEELLSKQRKEKKDLQEQYLLMKKAAKCGNKQKQKETNAEIEEMEKTMKVRHAKELDELTKELEKISIKETKPVELEKPVERTAEEETFYKQGNISSKNKKKQAKKVEAATRLKAALEADQESALSSMRFYENNALTQVLDGRGLQLYDIHPDGDCLYNSIAHQLNRTSGSTEDDGNLLDEFEFETYCSKVENEAKNGGVWGGEPELIAISKSLERKIEMSADLAVQRHEEFPSLAGRLIQLIYVLCDDALDYLWSIITKKSKLERMLEGSGHLHASKIVEIERFLTQKLHVHANLMFRSSEDCDGILTDGNVSAKGEERDELKQRLSSVIKTIDSYEELRSQVESIRREKYDSNNPSHEEKLRDLWRLLVPHETLENRIGKQWRCIGFQGDDPATDFRGMGILSLDQLLYLAKNYQTDIQQILGISHHPKIGFPLAVAGITFTSVTRQLLASGKLKRLFYRTKNGIDLNLFNETYCKIFITFVAFWKATDPESIMEFNNVRAIFERKLNDELEKEKGNIESVTV